MSSPMAGPMMGTGGPGAPIGGTPGPVSGYPPPPVPGPVPGPTPNQDFLQREKPDPDEPRRKLVNRWQARVKRGKRYWEKPFKRMRSNMEFVEGRQWPGTEIVESDKRDDRYVANICIRHVLQRTAELYPNNPTMKAKSKPKLVAQTWNGTMQQLVQAQQSLMMARQTGIMDPNAMAILQDAAMVERFADMTERVGRTLEILYDYNIAEQNHSFNGGMKMSMTLPA